MASEHQPGMHHPGMHHPGMHHPGMHHDEYDESLVAMLELIWGEGYMAPGGPGNVRQVVGPLDLRAKTVLDIGCGLGGPDLVLAGEFGARVIGLEIERPLIERARRYAERAGLAERIEFRHVAPGRLPLADQSVDVVFSSGVFIHLEDKRGAFREVLRVLRPGGWLAAYDWLKGPGPYSEDMRYWFEMEGLTYSMDTLENYERMLREAGFVDIETTDNSEWYRRRCREEHEQMRGPLRQAMLERLGAEKRAHFVENWRAMTVVLDKGELRTAWLRARKPGEATG